jgi:hypothetical protein
LFSCTMMMIVVMVVIGWHWRWWWLAQGTSRLLWELTHSGFLVFLKYTIFCGKGRAKDAENPSKCDWSWTWGILRGRRYTLDDLIPLLLVFCVEILQHGKVEKWACVQMLDSVNRKVKAEPWCSHVNSWSLYIVRCCCPCFHIVMILLTWNAGELRNDIVIELWTYNMMFYIRSFLLLLIPISNLATCLDMLPFMAMALISTDKYIYILMFLSASLNMLGRLQNLWSVFKHCLAHFWPPTGMKYATGWQEVLHNRHISPPASC